MLASVWLHYENDIDEVSPIFNFGMSSFCYVLSTLNSLSLFHFVILSVSKTIRCYFISTHFYLMFIFFCLLFFPPEQKKNGEHFTLKNWRNGLFQFYNFSSSLVNYLSWILIIQMVWLSKTNTCVFFLFFFLLYFFFFLFYDSQIFIV